MKPEDFRIVYAGTPDFAMPALAALIDAGYDVVAVYTQPDRRAGRGRKLQMSPVKALALEHNIPVKQPSSMRDEEQVELLARHNADLMIVAAYGQILPVAILETPKLGCLNIHASLLPRWRGAAPIHRAIEQGDRKTGVTIMQMDKGLDTGDMLHKVECDIDINTTGIELHDKLASLGSDALLHTLELLHAGDLIPVAQDDAQACYANKLEKSEAVIDWSRTAEEIHRKVCAFNAWPVAQTVLDGDTLRIWQSVLVPDAKCDGCSAGQVIAVGAALDVATGSGVLRITTVQPSGKKPMPVSDFLNSRQLSAGTQLG